MQETIKKTLDDSLKLYSLPQTLAEVLRVVGDENSGADDLAKVLMKDPALTTRVLRVVNSPYYGVGREIGTVSQATVTLGMRQITALALSTSVYGLTSKWKSEIDRDRFWRHALETAIAARSISEKTGHGNPEELFVCGLLHDIGLLVLEQSFPDEFMKVWKQVARGGSLIELEEERWGTNHARVGQFLLEQWRLPTVICEAVGAHYHTFPQGADEPDVIAPQIVALSSRIAHFRLTGSPSDSRSESGPERDMMRANLGLSTRDMIEIEKSLFAQTLEEARYLEIDVGSPEEILTEANEMLFAQYAEVEQLLRENRRINQQFAGEQVKTGFLESLKATASAFTEYIERALQVINLRLEQVEAGVDSGAVIDKTGLLDEAIRSVEQEMQAVNTIMAEMKRLTQTESALYYDQVAVEAVENRIRDGISELSEAV